MINEYFDDLFDNDLSLNTFDNCVKLEETSNQEANQLKKLKIDCNKND